MYLFSKCNIDTIGLQAMVKVFVGPDTHPLYLYRYGLALKYQNPDTEHPYSYMHSQAHVDELNRMIKFHSSHLDMIFYY